MLSINAFPLPDSDFKLYLKEAEYKERMERIKEALITETTAVGKSDTDGERARQTGSDESFTKKMKMYFTY